MSNYTLEEFNKLTPEQLAQIPDEEWKAIDPKIKRSCADCKHLKSAMHFYCNNLEAIQYRGTSLPGCVKCIFWEERKHLLFFTPTKAAWNLFVERIKQFL